MDDVGGGSCLCRMFARFVIQRKQVRKKIIGKEDSDMKIFKRLLIAVFGGLLTAILFSTIFSAATGGLLAPFCALSFPLQWIVAGVIGCFATDD